MPARSKCSATAIIAVIRRAGAAAGTAAGIRTGGIDFATLNVCSDFRRRAPAWSARFALRSSFYFSAARMQERNTAQRFSYAGDGMEERTHEKCCSRACRGWCDRTCGDGDAGQCRILHRPENAVSRIERDRRALLASPVVVALGLPPRLSPPLAFAPLVVTARDAGQKRNGRSCGRPFCIRSHRGYSRRACNVRKARSPNADHLVEPPMNGGLRAHSGEISHASHIGRLQKTAPKRSRRKQREYFFWGDGREGTTP